MRNICDWLDNQVISIYFMRNWDDKDGNMRKIANCKNAFYLRNNLAIIYDNYQANQAVFLAWCERKYRHTVM